jgi:hypothetical protein
MRFVVMCLLFLSCAAHKPTPQPVSLGCEPGVTRCNQNRTEMCNASGTWDVMLDCESFGECKMTEEEGALCL